MELLWRRPSGLPRPRSCSACCVFPGRPGRLKSFSYLGCRRYSLTLCTAGRRLAFQDPNIVRIVTSQFLLTARQEHFAVLAYCFMPDHVHLLVEALSDGADLQRFVKLAKQRAAFICRGVLSGRLWQPSYYDRVLRDSESTLATARYILENPVRAGMVSTIEDYPYSGSDILQVKHLIRDLHRQT